MSLLPSPSKSPTTGIVPANILAALKGRYPFGGEMRHEIFLLPIAVLCLFAGLERARWAAPARWSSRRPWNAAAALGVGAVVLLGIARMPVNTAPLSGEQMASFRASFGKPPAILVDQFNFVVLFGQHHEWRWRLR